MSKSSALKRATPDTGSWRPLPASMEALVYGNIEQAADLGAGYVILKLRTPSKPRRPLSDSKVIETELPVMTRERLVTALHRGGTLAGVNEVRKRPPENDAFMRNMATQEQQRRGELEQSGQLITAEELAARLDVSTQAISKALKAGRLFALEGGGRRLLYPAFYADGKVARRELETVTRALGDIPASSKWQFFTTPKGSLNGTTPLQALQRGDRQVVMTTAAGFVER